MNYVIGCGGIGSWLATSLSLLVGRDQVALIDGDIIERRNLMRQLYKETQIGLNKARALGSNLGVSSYDIYFSEAMMQFRPQDWLMVCADNHAARKAALVACDMSRCRAIIAANETYSSEAYVYLPEWRNTGADPRQFYPAIETDTTGDPRRAQAGCTGEAQEETPQLVSANFAAAALAQSLYVLWAMEARKWSDEVRARLPHHYRINLAGVEAKRACDSLVQGLVPPETTETWRGPAERTT